MSDKNKNDRMIDAPLDTNSPAIISEKAYGNILSPKQRGRSPEKPLSSHSSSPAGSTTGPVASFGPLSPGAADLIYPIRSAVTILHPLQPTPGSPNTLWSANSSVVESTASGIADEVVLGLGIRSRSHSRSPKSSLGQCRRASVVSVKEIYDMASSERGTSSKSGNLSIAESLGKSAEEGDEGTMLGGGNQPADEILGEGHMAARFKYLMTDDGHAVITGVSGTENMQRCEDEPIHIPGAVQGFGLLIALEEDENGKLNVKIASENSQLIIGYSPSTLFALDDFCNILSNEQSENLYEHLAFVQDDAFELVHSGPDVFPLIIIAPDSTNIKLWCAIHILKDKRNLVVCELELEDDHLFPLFSPTEEESSPPPPEDTLNSNPSEQELLESTTSISRPLRVFRKRRGQAATMEIFNLMGQIQEQLSSATDLDTFLKISIGIVKELTGFHRVMVYQFDESWNGRVVTELVDSQATKDLYKGLNFPASDIPKQARDLYRINKVRLLYDRDQETARLVCESKEYLVNPLDMTHSYLRAMSPVHIKYLKNMAVRASMSISITSFNELWGLVSCHSYGQRGMRVSFPIRKMCRLIGEMMSRNIERLSYASRLHARKLINTVPTEKNPSGYIVASSDDLLALFDADFGLLSIREETKVLGKLDHLQEALALLEYLRMRNFTSVITSQDLNHDFPNLSYAPGFPVIAGLLLVPLTIAGGDFIVFFRKGQLQHVKWAGNPYEKALREGTRGYLEPRASFKVWSETVVGKCREWTEEQVETAAVLCLVYGKFIEVWRQREAALQNSRLTKLLLANASHEVRTPLNAIINYLEIALESPLDTEIRDNLIRSHTASKSLIYVINDLLDLTRTEKGQDLVMDEIFDLSNTIGEAASMFRSDTERKNISLEIVEYPGLPKLVKGDQSRLRQAVSNLVGNAVKHTNTGGIQIEMWASEALGDRCQVEIAIQDTGAGISPGKLEMLFREFEQVQPEDEREVGVPGCENETPVQPRTSQTFDALSKIPGQKMLGIGLAVVARTIRNMNGQLRLKSEERKGSRFIMSLPFTLPPETENVETGSQALATREPSPQPQSMMPPLERSLGELLLINSSPQNPRSSIPITRENSSSNVNSLRSQSSNRSEIEGITPIPYTLNLDKSSTVSTLSPMKESVKDEPGRFNVLVAEDDPINSKIIKKRMEKLGHEVSLTVNGAECADLFMRQGGEYDIVLMDMQMPIMDGGTSTTRIRGLEASGAVRGIPIKNWPNGRVPIFAVSASLVEERRKEYMSLGFDGWILKPVDFKRLQVLMDGILDPNVRESAAYQPGAWERGGWFLGSPEVK